MYCLGIKTQLKPFHSCTHPCTQALKPYGHYVPWWARDPSDIMDRIKWIRDNPQRAAEISTAGADFARYYLTATGRRCYWFRVLMRLAEALQYTPPQDGFRRATPVARFRREYVLRMRTAGGQRPMHGMPFEP